MLEFIVLGQIPGTNLQITFFQIALLAAFLFLSVLVAHELKYLPKSTGNNQSEIERRAI